MRELIKYIADDMPTMNKALMRDFHRNSVDNIPEVAEYLYELGVETLHVDGHTDFEYIGSSVATPDQRLDSLKDEAIWARVFNIAESYTRDIIYEFRHGSKTYNMVVQVPYLYDNHVRINNVDNFPIFVIADKGGVGCKDNEIYLKVLRLPLIFKRNRLMRLPTEEWPGLYASNITAKVHYGKKGRKEPPPAILFMLARYGLQETIRKFDAEGLISVVDKVERKKGVFHVNVKEGIYIRYDTGTDGSDPQALNDAYDCPLARVVAGLWDVLTYYTDYTFDELFSRDFFRVALGAFIQEGMDDKAELMKRAEEFQTMNTTTLDRVSRELHESVGVDYEDMEDLARHMIMTIDDHIIYYNLNKINMFDKSIQSTFTLMARSIEDFNKRVFNILNTKDDKNIGSAFAQLVKRKNYCKALCAGSMFDVISTRYNDNNLYHLCKRKIIVSGSEGKGKKKAGAKKTSVRNLRFHSSYPVVMSMFTYPPTSPVLGGTINPYTPIDEHGAILEPDFYDDVRDVFGPEPNPTRVGER